MSFTKNYRVACDSCGLFCVPFDEETPFGCADPENPEPYDPYHYCEKCWPDFKKKWVEALSKNHVSASGYWDKSRAEREAAKELGLEWVHSNGYIDTRTNLDIHYRYIKTSEREHYIPYLEFLSDPENRKLHQKAKDERFKKLPSIF